jgi:hypothetical protein
VTGGWCIRRVEEFWDSIGFRWTDLGQVYQAIRAIVAYNVAETKSLLGTAASCRGGAARYVRSTGKCEGSLATFERSGIWGQAVNMGHRSVTGFLSIHWRRSRVWVIDVPIPLRDGGAGWLEVTHLDETLRISWE